jgi:hypothetical protein
MKIEEILIIGVDPDLKDTFLSRLPLDGQRIHNVDIYQLEIDTDLRIFFYDLDLSHRIPIEFMDHIKPHLSGVLIIGDSNLSSHSSPKMGLVNDIVNGLENIPIVIAAVMNGKDPDTASRSFNESGLYLSKNSRLCLWKYEDVSSIKAIWRALLVDLQEQKPAD